MDGLLIIFLLIPIGFTTNELIRLFDEKERAIVLGRRWVSDVFFLLISFLAFVLSDLGADNDCCTDSAFFSPTHRLSAVLLATLCMAAYFYSSWRKRIAPPIPEVVVNCFLLIGPVFGVFIGLHFNSWIFWPFFYYPYTVAFVVALMRNHRLFMNEMEARMEEGTFLPPRGLVTRFCWNILKLEPFKKYPVLLLLCLPVLVIMIGILLLFGQKPDSLVKAFTETYKHGLSQIDQQCDGVVCPGGHFLCTIAAKGHTDWVKPLRTGVRAGMTIACNRQLLVSNAFEEWLEQRWPAVHRPIRRFYNKIGAKIRRHYGVFNRKWVADLIYVLMKPLEWLFVLVLYIVDKEPETRIAQQYMSRADRSSIRSGRASSIA